MMYKFFVALSKQWSWGWSNDYCFWRIGHMNHGKNPFSTCRTQFLDSFIFFYREVFIHPKSKGDMLLMCVFFSSNHLLLVSRDFWTGLNNHLCQRFIPRRKHCPYVMFHQGWIRYVLLPRKYYSSLDLAFFSTKQTTFPSLFPKQLNGASVF